MLNNRGQSLVLFVLIIPIILMVMILVVDVGKLVLLKQELNDINYMAMDYGLDVINEDDIVDEITDLINKNKSDIDKISIKLEEEIIYIEIEDSVDFMFLNDTDMSRVNSSYLGYINEGKKIIERDK